MITNEDAFRRNLPAGFDGVFNWDWTAGCFGENGISPMDFDGVVERKGQFLLFETKAPGKDVPAGKVRTLVALTRTGIMDPAGRFYPCWTVMLVYGKAIPEHGKLWYPGGRHSLDLVGVESMRSACARWFAWADAGGFAEVAAP